MKIEPHLPAGVIQLWRLHLPELAMRAATLQGWLVADELTRAAAFHKTADRRRFVLTRGVLRELLGHTTGAPPGACQIASTPRGKPWLAAPVSDPPLHFNVAHSGDVALIALCRGQAVGVDVEAVDADADAAPLDELDGLAQSYFAPAEVAALQQLAPPARLLAFYRIWTRKEAWLKLLGDGLARPLNSFAVSHTAEAHLLWVQDEAAPAQRWTLVDLPLRAGYVGALAVAGPRPTLQLWDYPPQGVLRELP